ncbi:MAG: hypothetical protein ACJ8LV_09855, partial [Chthoniobacterales bacterium]
LFQRHLAPRAEERGVVRHSATHVNVIPSEVEEARDRALGGFAGSFDFAQDDGRMSFTNHLPFDIVLI